MKIRIAVVVLFAIATVCNAQSSTGDYLSTLEIQAALNAKKNTGFVRIQDGTIRFGPACTARQPAIALFTPEGWINARGVEAKKQFLQFEPTEADTLRALTIEAVGCAMGTSSGPACDSITRVALISDKSGELAIESLENRSTESTWRNGFGAATTCTSLTARFAMSDVKRVSNNKGEFQVATFDGKTLLKIYTVKEKHLKDLGLK